MAARVLGFVCVTLVLVQCLSSICAPLRSGTYTHETIRDMYKEPRNSVQLVILGASAPLSAFSPMAFYEEYGIGAYNCSTSAQPLIMSYYLLEEMLRLHGDSLSTVIIDPAVALKSSEGTTKASWAERVLLNMAPSTVKLRALLDLNKYYDDASFVGQLVPVLAYHSRWSSLTSSDFVDSPDTSYTRGQYVRYSSNLDNGGETLEVTSANRGITEEIDYSASELSSMWNERSKVFLDRIVDLCRERGLNLLFITTPRGTWDNKSHDSVQLLVDSYGDDGISYLDLSTPDKIEAYGISYATDYVDVKHPNVHGGVKLSHWIGDYLIRHYEFEDMRTSQFSEEFDRDARLYDLAVKDGDLAQDVSLEEYLSMLDDERYAVFVAAKGGVTSLDESARAACERLGLARLASLGADEGYCGVLDGGVVVAESASEKRADAHVSGQYRDGTVVAVPASPESGAVLPYPFELTGPRRGDDSNVSMVVDGENRAPGGSGLCFVVYNKLTGELLDRSSFD